VSLKEAASVPILNHPKFRRYNRLTTRVYTYWGTYLVAWMSRPCIYKRRKEPGEFY